MSACATTDVAGALVNLTRAYQEEAGMYLAMRDITVRQYQALCDADLLRFGDLFDEKEDLLAIIGQIDAETEGAKGILLSGPTDETPERLKLASLLDRITQVIEEIRLLESHNAALLDSVPVEVA
jgi:hypothetical protein